MRTNSFIDIINWILKKSRKLSSFLVHFECLLQGPFRPAADGGQERAGESNHGEGMQ